MTQKKIRGHKRRQKQIEKWKLGNMNIELVDYLLNQRETYYTKINIHPWNSFTITNSKIPEPTRKTKLKMLESLLDIYENWKMQLDKSGMPYYLKIWLFDPRFSKSEVVCAIGNSLDFYENTFFKPDENKIINLDVYPKLKAKLEKLDWECGTEEDHYLDTEVGNPEQYDTHQEYKDAKIRFEKQLSKPHRTYKLQEPGEAIELYSFKRGYVWIGGNK